MTAVLMPEGRQSFENSAGAPLVGGKVWTYDAGTSTPRPTFTTAAGVTPNANPVVLDARGEATIFWSGAYKVVLTDSADVVIWTVDGVQGADVAALASTAGAGLIGFLYAATYSVGTVGRWLQGLALSIGSTFIGWMQAGAGAVLRTVYSKLRGEIHVEDFGAVGDGATDDSASFALAFATAQIGTLPSKVKTTPGKTYLVSNLNIVAAALMNNTRGEYSLVFDYSGSTLKGGAAATRVLLLGSDTGTTTWTNGVRITHGTIDMGLMPDVATSIGFEMRNTYKNDISGLVVMGEGANKIGFNVRDRAYTTLLTNISCLRMNLVGANLSTDPVTTFNIINPDVRKLTLTKCSSIRVEGGAIQNDTGDKVAMTDVFDITFDSIDIEGAAGTAYAALNNNCSFVRIRGGNITAALTPFTGEFNGSDLGPIRYRGEYHNLYGRPSFNVNGSGPFVVWTQTGEVSSGGVSTAVYVYTVTGNNGSDIFSDEVKVYATFFKVLDSWNVFGSPATRTYSLSGTSFRVSFSSPFVSNITVGVRVIPA